MNFLVGLNVAGDLSAADNAPRRNFGLNDRRLSDNQCSMGDDFSFDFSINPDGAVIGNHPFELGPFSKKSDDLFRLSSLIPFISSQRSLLKGRKGSRSFPGYIRSPESGPVRSAIPIPAGRELAISSIEIRSVFPAAAPNHPESNTRSGSLPLCPAARGGPAFPGNDGAGPRSPQPPEEDSFLS